MRVEESPWILEKGTSRQTQLPWGNTSIRFQVPGGQWCGDCKKYSEAVLLKSSLLICAYWVNKSIEESGISAFILRWSPFLCVRLLFTLQVSVFLIPPEKQ